MAKLCNQIAVAGNMLGMVESLTFARKAGLDPRKVLQSVGSGAASSVALNVLGPRILDGDFSPGFFVHHFLKDLKLALEEAESQGWNPPGVVLAKSLYQTLVEKGMGEMGTQALYRLY